MIAERIGKGARGCGEAEDRESEEVCRPPRGVGEVAASISGWCCT